MIRCSKLQELEAAYSEALSENAAAKSIQCATLCREHVKHMHELEEQALDAENKSRQDFLFTCQAILCRAATASQRESVCLLPCLVRVSYLHHFRSIPLTKTPQTEEQTSATASSRPEPKQSPWPKRWHSSPDPQGDMSIDEISPTALQEGLSSSKRRETADWFTSLKPSHVQMPSVMTLTS